MRTLEVSVFRKNPLVDIDEPHFDVFFVEETKGMSVLLLLDKIQEKDASLYYESVCRSSICGSCAIKVNGRPKLACKTQTSDLSEEIILEPLDFFPVIKDLATDKSKFFDELNRKLEAWVHREKRFCGEEERMSDELATKLYARERCIECGICFSACPASRFGKFISASGVNKGLRFVLDPRNEDKDAIDRLVNILSSDNGLWGCHGVGACQNFCPKEIPLLNQLAENRKAILKLIICEWFKKKKKK